MKIQLLDWALKHRPGDVVDTHPDRARRYIAAGLARPVPTLGSMSLSPAAEAQAFNPPEVDDGEGERDPGGEAADLQ